MKKWLFLLAICLLSITFADPIQDRKIAPAALKELASFLQIPEDADLIAETQKRWLRKPGQERWEMSEIASEQKAFVLNWAKQQGLLDPWKPLDRHYDKALILGATTSRMKARLDYLVELWEKGTRFSEVVWLTGDRPLDPRADDLLDRCLNESEAARILWNEANLPEEMRSLPVVFIAVPMKGEGSFLKRPDTKDTLDAWVASTNGSCTALFISGQPFCGYQFAVINATLPATIHFDVVGPSADPSSLPSEAAAILDSVARWIYQDAKMQKKQEKF